jgi:hypothetical protein
MYKLETLPQGLGEPPLPAGTERADIAVLGRSSYPYINEAGEYHLGLTKASELRGKFAERIFDPEFHDSAAFGGGYRAAQANLWPVVDGKQWLPSEIEREGYQMAVPLVQRLRGPEFRLPDDRINQIVKAHGLSNNTLLDVYHMVRLKHIDPAKFDERGVVRGLVLGMGPKHGWRGVDAFSTVLDIDPKHIALMPKEDPYGRPASASGLLPPESAARAHAEEDVARVFHIAAMQGVRRGDIDDLGRAADRFSEMVEDPKGAVLRNPIGMIRSRGVALVK